MNSDEFSAAGVERYADAASKFASDGDETDNDNSRKSSPSAAGDEEDDGDKRGSKKWTETQLAASLPGTSQHRRALRRLCRPPPREYASESETLGRGLRRRRRWAREKKLERAWEIRKCRTGVSSTFVSGSGGSGENGGLLVVVQSGGGCGRRICMDMEEVKACHDLGLEIPRDFTVEIPGGISGNSSCGDSLVSCPGEETTEIKEKLKLWAHAVAFVSSAARTGN